VGQDKKEGGGRGRIKKADLKWQISIDIALEFVKSNHQLARRLEVRRRVRRQLGRREGFVSCRGGSF
jgi:hypothetical protein